MNWPWWFTHSTNSYCAPSKYSTRHSMYNDNQNTLRTQSLIIYKDAFQWLLMKMRTIIALGYWNVCVKIPSWNPFNKDCYTAYITQILILFLSYSMKTQRHHRCWKQPWRRTYWCVIKRALKLDHKSGTPIHPDVPQVVMLYPCCTNNWNNREEGVNQRTYLHVSIRARQEYKKVILKWNKIAYHQYSCKTSNFSPFLHFYLICK